MTVEGLTVSVTHHFPQPAGQVWALLTDVERMAGLGPEHVVATWDSDARGLGATFHGTNRRGRHEWTVPCTVVTCEEPTSFAWDAGDPAEPFATWSYLLTQDETGTTVKHTFTHGPGESGVTSAIAKYPDAERDIIANRCGELEANMTTALTEAAKLLS